MADIQAQAIQGAEEAVGEVGRAPGESFPPVPHSQEPRTQSSRMVGTQEQATLVGDHLFSDTTQIYIAR